ncbi:MAG: DNA repair protein RecO [Pseudomonadota bacterium]
MEWSDEALILSVRSHGETASIAEVFSRAHGRYFGLVHGGQSRRRRPILQIGNHVDAIWKARLADQLGHIQLELKCGFAAKVLDDRAGLAMLMSLAALLRQLPERDAHGSLYEISMFVLGFLDDPDVWPALYVRWEMALLDELGFGLDITACAATGTHDDLIYVSPKSGRAVSASAGEPYKDKLLPLPAFLLGRQRKAPSMADVLAGLQLTEYFLVTRVFEQCRQALPEARIRLAQLLRRAAFQVVV